MWRFARLPSEKWTERRTDTGGDRLRHLDQTLANIGKHWPIRRQDSGNGCEFVGLGGGWVERGGWMKGIRDKMFDIGGPYREDARCFRAEAISSCAVVLTLTAAETRLTERSSVWRRRGTVTYHLENRGGGGHRDVAIQLLFPLFHHRCLLMARIWRPTDWSGFSRLPSRVSFCVFDLSLRSLSNLTEVIVVFAGLRLLRGYCWSYFGNLWFANVFYLVFFFVRRTCLL